MTMSFKRESLHRREQQLTIDESVLHRPSSSSTLHSLWSFPSLLSFSCLLSFLCLLSLSCSSAPPISSEEIRSRLRANARTATEVDYSKPIGKRANEPALPEGVSCLHSASCFPQKYYLTAEGVGEDPRGAELDAKARLSSKIKSEIKSVITTMTREGDGVGSQVSGEIKNEVRTSFKYGELISIYPLMAKRDGDSYKALAVLDKRSYQERVEPSLRSHVKRAQERVTRSRVSPELLIQEWPQILATLGHLAPALIEYKSIVGDHLKSAEKLQKDIQVMRKEIDEARSKLTFVLEVSDLNTSSDSALDLPIKSVMSRLFRTQRLRILSPGDCLPQRHRLLVTYETNESVHPVTGSPLLSLEWSLTLFRCPVVTHEKREQELITVKLPPIKGTERYQTSAQQVIASTLKQLNALMRANEMRAGEKSVASSSKRSRRETIRQARTQTLANKLSIAVKDIISILTPI